VWRDEVAGSTEEAPRGEWPAVFYQVGEPVESKNKDYPEAFLVTHRDNSCGQAQVRENRKEY
jgi:hypothetical protein